MKPTCDRLALVTASLAPADDTTRACVRSWDAHAMYGLPLYQVWDQMGVVPAFAQGVAKAFEHGAEAVLAIHDDVLIEEEGWDLRVLEQLDRGVRYMGFGGATSLGAADIYRTPYDPMQLARGGFVSNMRDAEAHGRRSEHEVCCVVFDGFATVGTADWFAPAWEWLGKSGIIHHAYDAALGAYAARAGVQPGVMIPIRVHHYGGRSAVGSVAYQEWANRQVNGGDAIFWQQSHRTVWEAFQDVLPLTVDRELFSRVERLEQRIR
jgi:hypothetical protein